MPCFLAGAAQGAVLAKVLGVPFFELTHQQGHIAAAAWSARRMDLLEKPHLAWHLSGGTTELLYVRPKGPAVSCEVIGGTSDISAGQLIDRAGQLVGLKFPSGAELDALAQTVITANFTSRKTAELEFSLSGVEHKMKNARSGANRVMSHSSHHVRCRGCPPRHPARHIEIRRTAGAFFRRCGLQRAAPKRDARGDFRRSEILRGQRPRAAILTYRAFRAGGQS